VTETLWLLLLISAVGAGCFYAGWRSAAAYLSAASAVSTQTNMVIAQSNSYSVALDKAQAESASLRAAVDRQSEALVGKQRDIEAALQAIFVGFERAGVVRSQARAVGRQVGETGTEQG